MEARIGIVGKPHGLRGEVTVRLTTDEPERRFAPGASVLVAGVSTPVAGSRWHGGGLLVAFAGVSDRSGAEELRGREITVTVDDSLIDLDADEFFDRQLIGFAVRNHHGVEVGRIVGVEHLPAQDVLVVDLDGVERLVPFVAALVPIVGADFVQIADVGGLIDDREA